MGEGRREASDTWFGYATLSQVPMRLRGGIPERSSGNIADAEPLRVRPESLSTVDVLR